jgi:ABC-type multidrug transport system ATPase subunit
VTKRFGRVAALDDVSLDIQPGQIVAVLGANGAGKTTLLRALAGNVAPDDGEILYDGELFRRDRIDLRRRFCFLADFPEVFPDMTLLRHIGMMVALYESERPGIEQTILELLREFALLPLIDAPLRTLSRGQAYKAALLGLLVVDPEVWMLDEPFASGMDPAGITGFRRHVRSALARGRTCLYTTQIVELAEGFSDAVCVLEEGRIAAFGAIDRLRHASADNRELAHVLALLQVDSP